MHRYFVILVFINIFLLGSFSSAQTITDKDSAATAPAKRRGGPPVGWYNSFRAGFLHQFKTKTDSNSQFDVNRFAVSYSLGYGFDKNTRAGLSFGYVGHDYNFDSNRGGVFDSAWGQVNSFRVSSPIFFSFQDNWNAILIPTIRTTGVSGASTSDSINGGVITGASYKFSDSFSIGPGLGVLTQIEDDPSYFPILLIDWKITERLSLSTGRGFGSTQGPGLSLAWKASRKTNLFLLGRYERLRFRLDDNEAAPKGVGEDRSFPLLLGVSHRVGPAVLTATGGVELAGELSVEDEDGNEIKSEDYDPAFILGLTVMARF